MRISAMGTVIPLLILLSKTIINYGETRRVCPPEMSIDDGNEGRQYCRPKICNGNKCVEEQDNVTCQTVTGNRESCSMIINWTLQSKTADIISCVINQGEMKYVDSITVARKCFSRGSNSYSKIMKKDCTNVERCDLNFSHCHSDKKSQPQLETIIACEARSSVNLQNKTKEINLLEKIKVVISKNRGTLHQNENLKGGEIVDCKLENDEFLPVKKLIVNQRCEGIVSSVSKRVCKTRHCSLKILGLLKSVSKCNVECRVYFEGTLESILGRTSKLSPVNVQGATNVTLDFNDGNLKSNGIISIYSPITCQVKSSHNLQNIVANIIIRQYCDASLVYEWKCRRMMRCRTFPDPCNRTQIFGMTCEDTYVRTNFKMVQNINFRWIAKLVLKDHRWQEIHQAYALTNAEQFVACYSPDTLDLLETVTIKQICNSHINEVQQCRKRYCSMHLRGTLGSIDCRIECSAEAKKWPLLEVSVKQPISPSIKQTRVTYPDATSPMIEFQGTVLHNNDVIHVNDTLLKCSVKLLDETNPKHISKTKIHLKITIQCSSIVKSTECNDIYTCRASIALCQFLDRVHVTCAEYYSEKINRILLHRRIDGAWGHWLPWTNWDPPCGKRSTRFKTRNCDSPYPRNGGKQCKGSRVVTETRESHVCSDRAPDDVWGAWSAWSSCSSSCNTGLKVRNRQCLSTSRKCVGMSKMKTTCVEISCAVHHKKMSVGLKMSLFLSVPAAIIICIVINSVYVHIKKTSNNDTDNIIITSDNFIE